MKDEDYSHFDAKYGVTKKIADPETLKHAEWLHSMYGTPSGTSKVLTSVNRLLTEKQTFVDSRNSRGVQLADMLASILRRALNNRLGYDGWKDFGGLLIGHPNPGTGVITIGPDVGHIPLIGHARKVCRDLYSKAKPIIAKPETV